MIHLKFTLCGDAISILDRTKKTPSGGNVITLLRVLPRTSMTCNTSPARVPNKGAFSTMKSCSFSVVQSSRQVPERESPVVTEPAPRAAIASIASTIDARLAGSLCVLRPRSWSEMRARRWSLAEDRDWAVTEEQVNLG